VLRRIEALGLRHRIASRRTSLVAISEEPAVDPKQPRRRRRLPVELPAGVSAEGVGLAAAIPRVASLAKGLFGAAPIEAQAACISSDGAIRALLELAPRPPRRKVEQPRPARATADQEIPVATVGCVLRTDGDLIVVEFESPEDGFFLPVGRTVRAIPRRIEAGSLAGPEVLGTVECRMDEALSTRVGPHGKALLLRLALRTRDASHWPEARPMTLEWDGPEGPVRIGILPRR
jgi:hypothetical protein